MQQQAPASTRPIALRQRLGQGRPAFEGLFAAMDGISKPAGAARLVAFTSAHDNEGKTVVLTEVIGSLAGRRSARLAVIDMGVGDDLARAFPSYKALSFPDVLSQLADAQDSQKAVSFGSSLTMIRLPPESRATDLLNPENLALFSQAFDFVLVELPSFYGAPNALASATAFDGIVIVVEAGVTRWPAIQEAREQLEKAGARIIGVVLNKRRFVIPRRVYNWL